MLGAVAFSVALLILGLTVSVDAACTAVANNAARGYPALCSSVSRPATGRLVNPAIGSPDGRWALLTDNGDFRIVFAASKTAPVSVRYRLINPALSVGGCVLQSSLGSGGMITVACKGTGAIWATINVPITRRITINNAGVVQFWGMKAGKEVVLLNINPWTRPQIQNAAGAMTTYRKPYPKTTKRIIATTKPAPPPPAPTIPPPPPPVTEDCTRTQQLFLNNCNALGKVWDPITESCQANVLICGKYWGKPYYAPWDKCEYLGTVQATYPDTWQSWCCGYGCIMDGENLPIPPAP